MRQKIVLSCQQCSSRNYETTINRQRQQDRLEINKFCKHCNKHTIHLEAK